MLLSPELSCLNVKTRCVFTRGTEKPSPRRFLKRLLNSAPGHFPFFAAQNSIQFFGRRFLVIWFPCAVFHIFTAADIYIIAVITGTSVFPFKRGRFDFPGLNAEHTFIMNKQYSPVCTVVIPVYNGAKYIGAALESVISQTFEGWRAIVVEDGSTDNTREIVEVYSQRDSRIEIIASDKKGVAHARNLGARHANSEWIAFLDSDDIWMPDKLESQLERVKDTKSVICYTGAAFIGPEGELTGRIVHVPESVSYEKLIYGNVIITSGALVKRDAMLACPMERDDLHEDFIFWLRILKGHGEGIGINKPLIAYRLTPGSKSRNKLSSARMAWNTYRYMGLSLPKTLRAFSGYIIHGIRRYFT